MNSEFYFFSIDKDRIEYFFDSIGPKGIINKRVRFLQTNFKGFFFLSFGDYNSETDEIDEYSVTNNDDTNKLIYTVVKIAIDFLQKNPLFFVQSSWRDELRLRLFNSWLNRNLCLMDSYLIIYGLIGELNNEKWERFQKNHRYKAVLIKLRNTDSQPKNKEV